MEFYYLVFPIALLLIWILFRWNYKVSFEVPYYIRIIYGLPFFFMVINVIELSIRLNSLKDNVLLAVCFCVVMTVSSVINIMMDNKSIKLYAQDIISRSISLTIVNYCIAISFSIYIWHFINVSLKA